MTPFGIAMVRDEADIIGQVVEHMLTQVDKIIILDDGSTDGTRDILKASTSDVHDRTELDKRGGYYQADIMTGLARIAREEGADWVIPFDADEWWTSSFGRLADVIEGLTDDYGIVTAELYDHVCTGMDGDYSIEPIKRIGWRRESALPLPKIACRTDWSLDIEQGNHWARYAIPARATEAPRLVVHHFPYRSPEQVIRKIRNGAAAYAKTDLPENVGAHWRRWGNFTDSQIEDLFHKWFYREDPRVPVTIDGEEQRPLVHDPV